MDASEHRRLAAMLNAQLADVIADEHERVAAAAELDAALALPPEQGDALLAAVLRSRPETRAWMRARMGDEPDAYRMLDLPGRQTAVLGDLFVCPEGDEDYVRENVGDPVPECSKHHLPMVAVGE
jgi:hypothetical protein